MRDVKNYWITGFFQDGERAHIHDKILIPEGTSSLRENNFIVACARHFRRGMFHFPRRKELRLLQIHHAAGVTDGK